MRGAPPPKAFPLGADSPCQGEMSRSDRGDRERWLAEGQTDEGAGFATISCYAGRISPPAGGEFLCPWRQRNQNAPGDGSDEHSVLIVAYPTPSGPSGHLPLTGGVGPGPHYGGSPLGQTENFRRAKMEWLSAIPPGPLGPGFAKIAAAAVPQQRLTLPNQRARYE